MLCGKILILPALVLLTACRIDIQVPETGTVNTKSGAYDCESGNICSVEVLDTGFNATFIASPAAGFQFIGWKTGYAQLCGGSLEPCQIDTGWYSDYEDMMDLLESDNVGYLEPEFIPSDYIRRYRAGDTVVFSGQVTTSNSGDPARTSNVDVRQEFLPGKAEYLDKQVLTLRTTTSYLETGEEQTTEQSIWQETNGELFELTNEYGNSYVTGSEFEKGLVLFPVPLIPSQEFTINFYTLYGGSVSGPVTEGSRHVSVAPMGPIQTPKGEYEAYTLNQLESFEYFFTYVDNKSGSTVVTERVMSISPAKGLVKKTENRREYSRSGALSSETRWELAVESTNF